MVSESKSKTSKNCSPTTQPGLQFFEVLDLDSETILYSSKVPTIVVSYLEGPRGLPFPILCKGVTSWGLLAPSGTDRAKIKRKLFAHFADFG